MDCREVTEKISAFSDNELEPALSKAIAEHIESCAACRAELNNISEMDALIGGLPDFEVSASFTRDVVRKSDSLRAPGRKTLAERAAECLLGFIGTLFSAPAGQKPGGARVLDEFGDVPASFIGYAYFRILS